MLEGSLDFLMSAEDYSTDKLPMSCYYVFDMTNP